MLWPFACPRLCSQEARIAMTAGSVASITSAIAMANPNITWLILIAAAVLVGLVVVVVALIVLMGGRRRVPPVPPPGMPATAPSPSARGYVPPIASGATMVQPGVSGAGWQLTVTAGPDAGRIFPLAMRAQIGRAAGNEVQLNDALASRAHALIEWRGSGYAVADLGSANGTLLNGVRLMQPMPIKAGDVIQVGGTQLMLSLGPTPHPGTSMPAPASVVGAPGAVAAPERGGCLTFKVLLYFVIWFVVFAIIAAAVYVFTKEPLAPAGVGLAALLSLIFMVRSLSESWYGQIVDIRTERVYVPGDEDSPGEWEDQEFAYIQQPGRRNVRKMRTMGGWQVGDWLEKRRGETHIRVRGR